MSLSKNWSAKSISGIAGFEIIVKGEANTGMLTIEPELHKRSPQGINPAILQLDLLNAVDAQPEHFRPVQYNEKIGRQDQYESVDIFHRNEIVETIKVEVEGKYAR